MTRTSPNNLRLYSLVLVIFLTECLLVGLGWLPYWVLVATVAVMAMAILVLPISFDNRILE